ncbi:MAG: DNA internalization-related competence protein ComEC/Rec2 [Eubacterium sp.]|nr:DNA internalization-related competence protein ComEC/Rec2 [Eubacterium sp.]
MKRPLMTLLGLFLLGLLAGTLTEYMIGIPILASAGIIWRSTGHTAKKLIHGMLLLFLFALGYLWSCGVKDQLTQELDALPQEGEKVLLTGTITDVGTKTCILQIGAGKILIRLPEEGGYLPGCGLRVEGEMISLQAESNPGGFDSKTYYESEGVIACVRAKRTELWEQGDRWFTKCLSRIREAAKTAIYRVLPEKEAGVLSAMLLGERAGLDQELKELYRRNGIAHILAISGLHVSLLGVALTGFLLLIGFSRRRAAGVSIVFLFLYGLMTGFSPATLRAVLMQTSVQLAGIFRRISDMPTAMTLSMFLILLFEPYRITSSGMLMSFLAAAAVASQQKINDLLFQRERFLRLPLKFRRPMKALTGSVLLSMLIQLFLLPVMLRDYYCISPYAPVLNLLVVPLLTLAVGSGALGMILALLPWSAWPGRIAALPCRGILTFYEGLCRGMMKVPGQEIITGHISDEEMVGMMLFTAGLVAVILYYLKKSGNRGARGNCEGRPLKKNSGLLKKRMKNYGAVLFCIVVCSVAFAGYAALRNHFRRVCVFFDVGQGDGCLIHTEDGNLLMDFGSTSKDEPGEKILIPGLRYYGITQVDLAILSHTDADHLNGVRELLEEGEEYGIHVSRIGLAAGTVTGEADGIEVAGSEPTTGDEKGGEGGKILAAAYKVGASIVWLSAGDVINLGEDTGMEVLYPARGNTGEGNEFSLVILLSVSGKHILFTGDIGAETEKELISILQEYPKTDVLKVAHHGSAYSSSEEFLKTIQQPGSVAVISCGRKNIYGHPAESTLKRLKEAGFHILRTDRNGAVILDLP